MECVEFKKISGVVIPPPPPKLFNCSILDRDLLFHFEIWDTISISKNATLQCSALCSFAFPMFYGQNSKILPKRNVRFFCSRTVPT